MSQFNLLLLNIGATLARMLATVFMGLMTTRVAYQQLGEEGFGAYAGGVALVMFALLIADALGSSAQRHIAHALGAGDASLVRRLTGGFVSLGAITAIGIAAGVGALSGLFASVLTAPQEVIERLPEAIAWIGVAVGFTTMQLPFKSYLIAKQSIVTVSVFELLDAVARLAAALSLLLLEGATIADYARLVALWLSLPTAALAATSLAVFPATRPASLESTGVLWSFAFWTVIGALGWRLRTQGVQVVINVLRGAAATAAYNVGLQLAMYQNNLSSAVYRAARPAVVSAHGRGSVDHVRRLTRGASKLLSICTLFIAVPALFETETLLRLWIGEAPEQMVRLVRLVLIAMSIKDLTLGYTLAIHATGRMARHELCNLSFDAAGILCAAAVLATTDAPPEAACVVVLVAVAAQTTARAALFGRAAHTPFPEWLTAVLGRYAVCAAAACLVAAVVQSAMEPSVGRLISLTTVTTITTSLTAYFIGLDDEERVRLSAAVRGAWARFSPGRAAAAD